MKMVKSLLLGSASRFGYPGHCGSKQLIFPSKAKAGRIREDLQRDLREQGFHTTYAWY